MIAWTYLDKKSAAVEALKDYTAMEFIITNHEDTEKELRERMTSVRSSTPTGMPHTHNPHAGEARLAAQIDEVDVLKERYRLALEYMAWFRPAWEQLDEDERLILNAFFLREDVSKTEIVLSVGEQLNIERTHVYRRKDKALNHLVLLLYGKQ
jgi:DNA-directed RNA polymerase specialized sigma subunit